MMFSTKIFAAAETFTAVPTKKIPRVDFDLQMYDIWTEEKYAGYCSIIQEPKVLSIYQLYLQGKSAGGPLRQTEPRHVSGYTNKGLGSAIVETVYTYAAAADFPTFRILSTRSVSLMLLAQHRYPGVTFLGYGAIGQGGNVQTGTDWIFDLDQYTFILPDQHKLKYRHYANDQFLPDGHQVFLYAPEIRAGQFILKNKLDGTVIDRQQGLRVELDVLVDIHIPVLK